MRLSPSWFRILSGLCVNLSAGWFAAILIIPSFSNRPDWLRILTGNLVFAIVYLYIAVKLDEFIP